MTPLTAIALITGISALIFVGMTLLGKFSDKIDQIRRVNPDRARRIVGAIALTGAALELLGRLPRLRNHNNLHPPAAVRALRVIHYVQPAYPPLARQNRVEGKVRLAAIVASDGQVQQLKPIAGDPQLVMAAMNAVKQWVFDVPADQRGHAPVRTEIDVNFRLSSAR